jgi:hypothetical protein
MIIAGWPSGRQKQEVGVHLVDEVHRTGAPPPGGHVQHAVQSSAWPGWGQKSP